MHKGRTETSARDRTESKSYREKRVDDRRSCTDRVRDRQRPDRHSVVWNAFAFAKYAYRRRYVCEEKIPDSWNISRAIRVQIEVESINISLEDQLKIGLYANARNGLFDRGRNRAVTGRKLRSAGPGR